MEFLSTGDKRKLLTIVGPGDSLVSPGIIAKWGGIKGYPPVEQVLLRAIQNIKLMMVKS